MVNLEFGWQNILFEACSLNVYKNEQKITSLINISILKDDFHLFIFSPSCKRMEREGSGDGSNNVHSYLPAWTNAFDHHSHLLHSSV